MSYILITLEFRPIPSIPLLPFRHSQLPISSLQTAPKPEVAWSRFRQTVSTSSAERLVWVLLGAAELGAEPEARHRTALGASASSLQRSSPSISGRGHRLSRCRTLIAGARGHSMSSTSESARLRGCSGPICTLDTRRAARKLEGMETRLVRRIRANRTTSLPGVKQLVRKRGLPYPSRCVQLTRPERPL